MKQVHLNINYTSKFHVYNNLSALSHRRSIYTYVQASHFTWVFLNREVISTFLQLNIFPTQSLSPMARLLAFVLSSLAIAAATPLTSDTSKQLSARQLPQCAGYGSVCRLDFTNRVNGTSGEFVRHCFCQTCQWLTVFML